MNAESRIRSMLPEEAGICSSLVRGCIDQDPSISDDLREVLIQSESPAAMTERAGLFYLAVLEFQGRVAGIGGIDLNEIRILCVAPELQRRGIGRQLLRHLENMVPPALFKEIFVYASPAASGFYRGNGYEARGEHVFRIGRHALRTVFMVKGFQVTG